MSKLITDSQVLMDLLFEGCAPDDTPIYCLIERLKEATMNCAEMRVTVEFERKEALRERISAVESALVMAWRQLLAVQNEFTDLTEEHFKSLEI